MQTPDIHTLIDQWLSHIGWSTVITFFGTATIFLIRVGYKVRKYLNVILEEWKAMRADQLKGNTMQQTAMDNHFPHIEQYTERTAVGVERLEQGIGKLTDTIQSQVVTAAKIQTMLETQGKWKN